jgi:hypothetical protein
MVFFTDRLIVVVGYLVAILGAWISMNYFDDRELWIKIAVGDFVGTVVIFLFSLSLKKIQACTILTGVWLQSLF